MATGLRGAGGRTRRDMCELYCYNNALVRRLQKRLPNDAALCHAEQFFSVLGNRTRLLILFCLSQARELCVCDIANALKADLSTISHQLRLLRSHGLVTYRSEGKMTFYRLADARAAEVACVGLAVKAPPRSRRRTCADKLSR